MYDLSYRGASSSPLAVEVAMDYELRLRGEVALIEGPQTCSP